MKINEYSTILNENRHVELRQKTSHEYEETQLNTPYKIAKMLDTLFEITDLPEEHVYLIAANSNMKSPDIFELSHGSIGYSLCQTREIFYRLLLCNAANFIVAHNHVSGSVKMSNPDIEAMQRLKEASKIMCIPMLDFLIISKDEGCLTVFSAKENDLLGSEG